MRDSFGKAESSQTQRGGSQRSIFKWDSIESSQCSHCSKPLLIDPELLIYASIMSAEYREGSWIDVLRQTLGFDQSRVAMREFIHCTEIHQTLSL